MTRKKITRFVVALAAALPLAACASSPDLQGFGPDELYTHANRELSQENWTAAIEAFERLALQYPTHPRAQEARYKAGLAYMGKEEYLTATSEFLRLVTDYPAGDFADDARFQVCRSYQALSPKIPLDQEYTRAAIDHCEALVAYYPESEFAGPAREIVTRMRDKLAAKVLYGGEYYFRRGAYDSAIVYFEDVLDRFPGTATAPRALLLLVHTYERLGYEDEMEEARRRLLERYPDSPQAREVQANNLASGG